MALFPYTIMPVRAIDWPQFMYNAQHNGDVQREQLELLLHLNVEIELDNECIRSEKDEAY